MAESHSQPAPGLDICNPAAREGREKLPSSKYTLGWGVGAECRMQGRDAPNASGKLASFSGEGRGSGALP